MKSIILILIGILIMLNLYNLYNLYNTNTNETYEKCGYTREHVNPNLKNRQVFECSIYVS